MGLHCAFLPQLQVAVQLQILQNAVACHHQRAPSRDFHPLHLFSQFLSKAISTVRHVAKPGAITTIGNSGSSAPPASSGFPSSISAPQRRRRWRLLRYMSDQQLPAPSPASPCLILALAEARSFLSVVKQQSRGTSVKPTASQLLSNLGQSCMRHSSRVEDLNLVLVESAYLGLINSLMRPCVRDSTSTQVSSFKTKQLVLPGRVLQPRASTGSPPDSLKRLSSWLYQTLTVSRALVCLWTRVVIAPTASPGFLGTARLLKSRLLSAETPSMRGKLRRANGLVSWKTTIHCLPSLSHFSAVPLMCSKVCTSPWPWGLVSISSLPATMPNLASLSTIVGTFSWLRMVTCSFCSPKYLFSSSRATVLALVSSEVMMASGMDCPLVNLRWKARMQSQQQCRKHCPVSSCVGSDTLMPGQPSLSPKPPATSTKAARCSCSSPALSYFSQFARSLQEMLTP